MHFLRKKIIIVHFGGCPLYIEGWASHFNTLLFRTEVIIRLVGCGSNRFQSGIHKQIKKGEKSYRETGFLNDSNGGRCARVHINFN